MGLPGKIAFGAELVSLSSRALSVVISRQSNSCDMDIECAAAPRLSGDHDSFALTLPVGGCQGVVDVHLPERWAVLQFAEGPLGGTLLRTDPDWALRTVAMGVYDAQIAYAAAHGGRFADSVAALAAHAPPHLVDGTCTTVPEVRLAADRRCWWAAVRSKGEGSGARRTACISYNRYLRVSRNSSCEGLHSACEPG